MKNRSGCGVSLPVPGAGGCLLEAENIGKDFPGVRALDGVSFNLGPGEIHALVGENGAGKSTLIKILAGVYPHGTYSGEFLVDGASARFRGIRDAETAGIAVVHQELVLVKHMTVGENIFLGAEPNRLGIIDYDRLFNDAGKVLRELGVAVDVRTEVATLGVGEQQLVEIARTVRKKSRILVLDEPTAALSESEIRSLMKVIGDLRSRGTAIVYISHKLDEVFALADRITVLRDGITVASGPVADWNRDKVIRAMVGRELKDMYPSRTTSPGQVVMEVENLSLPDPDIPGRMLLDRISFKLRSGEILGISGLMGSGRTLLVSALFGAVPLPWTGTVRVCGKPVRFNRPSDAIAEGIALVPEDRKRNGLNMMFRVRENLSAAHLGDFGHAGLIDTHSEFARALAMTGELGIKTPSVEAGVETLSGGNQQKVVLGKWLMHPPRIFFLDEPTRGIDIGAKAEIYKLMLDLTGRGMAVVMVSSELPEVLGMADRIMVLARGRVGRIMDRSEATPEEVMEAST